MRSATILASSQYHIAKRATDASRFGRPTMSFANARTAFKAFMLGLDLSSKDKVLLPAYIGWSAREGSGVFDPIREVGVDFRFYCMTKRLMIDLEDLRNQLDAEQPKLLVLIHYFGYPDPNIMEAVAMARKRDILILEDEAHALYSDWVGGICGRFGDAAILSLHKMLPFKTGGMLVLNDTIPENVIDRLARSRLCTLAKTNPLDYDLVSISAARRTNATKLLEMLQPLGRRIRPLHSTLPEGVVPQTLPVVVRHSSRDELYFRMNRQGYGVVSLYHTLIDPIEKSKFPDSHWLSRRILNLPVHQDASPGALAAMIRYLESLVSC